MVTLLALGAALSYGVADFLGGAVSRRSSALRALAWCVPVGLVVVLVAAVAIGGRFTWTSLAWGFGAGLAGGTGLITFYRALARGPMSVVAPVSALAAAVLPVGVGTLRGERLDTTVLAGVLLCLVAIGLVSMENNDPVSPSPTTGDDSSTRRTASSIPSTETSATTTESPVPPFGTPATAKPPTAAPGSTSAFVELPPGASGGTTASPEPSSGASTRPLDGQAVAGAPDGRAATDGRPPGGSPDGRAAGMPKRAARLADSGPLMAGISGVCFGIFFIMLKSAGDGGGLWPLVAARAGNLFVIGVALLVMARASAGDLGPPVSGWLLIGLALLSGVLDASANALYFVAAQQGMLSLAAVLTSLYPAITVLLARIAYSERLRVVQRLGLAVAAAGVALVTIG
jgi:drug/metabolite transporter (DMT)-like permease